MTTPHYLQVFVSAENKKQANNLLSLLLQKRLIAGGVIFHGPANFWWKAKILSADYYNISVFTKRKCKHNIEAVVKKVSKEEVPLIWFTSITANTAMLDWIEKSLQ